MLVIHSESTLVCDLLAGVIETDYDVAGRVLHRRATATGSGIDTAVLRISTAYTARGQVDTVTQHWPAPQSLIHVL